MASGRKPTRATNPVWVLAAAGLAYLGLRGIGALRTAGAEAEGPLEVSLGDATDDDLPSLTPLPAAPGGSTGGGVDPESGPVGDPDPDPDPEPTYNLSWGTADRRIGSTNIGGGWIFPTWALFTAAWPSDWHTADREALANHWGGTPHQPERDDPHDY